MIEYIAIGLVLIVIVIILYKNPKKNRVLHQEADIRLPYKKYKELYPRTGYSYVEYKKMQSREAFKTAIPSKKLKRMVVPGFLQVRGNSNDEPKRIIVEVRANIMIAAFR